MLAGRQPRGTTEWAGNPEPRAGLPEARPTQTGRRATLATLK